MYHVSGSEAMFADLCYFSVRSVQVKNEKLKPFLWYIELESWCLLADYYSFNLLGSFPLQLTFVCLVLPCLMLGYLGQAAYLMENPSGADQAFFSSIPSKLHCLFLWHSMYFQVLVPVSFISASIFYQLWNRKRCHQFILSLCLRFELCIACICNGWSLIIEMSLAAGGAFWPVFLIANIAALIASRAMTTATFSCIKQSMALGCFPRLKIIHTSRKFMGQIYIPVVNWFLLVVCLVSICSISSIDEIGNAYGNTHYAPKYLILFFVQLCYSFSILNLICWVTLENLPKSFCINVIVYYRLKPVQLFCIPSLTSTHCNLQTWLSC